MVSRTGTRGSPRGKSRQPQLGLGLLSTPLQKAVATSIFSRMALKRLDATALFEQKKRKSVTAVLSHHRNIMDMDGGYVSRSRPWLPRLRDSKSPLPFQEVGAVRTHEERAK